MKNNKSKKKGFTLIELLITIAILSLITVVLIVSVSGIINASKEKAGVINAKSLKDAANTYAQESKQNQWVNIPSESYEYFCVTVGELVNKGIIKKDKVEASEFEIETYVAVLKNKNTKTIEKEEILNEKYMPDDEGKSYKICTGQTVNEKLNKPKITKTEVYTDEIKLEFSDITEKNGKPINITKKECLYGTSSNDFSLGTATKIEISGNECKIENLEKEQFYYYKVCMETEKQSYVCSGVESQKTKNVEKPKIIIKEITENTEDTTKTIKIEYSNKYISGESTNYFTSNVPGITKEKVKECTKNNETFNCSDSLTTEIKENTWYKTTKESLKQEQDNGNNITKEIIELTILSGTEGKVTARTVDKNNNFEENSKEFIIHNIIFKKGNADSIDGKTTDIEKICISDKDKTCKIVTPTVEKVGYYGKEWNTKEDGTGIKLEIGQINEIDKDDTYYPVLVENPIFIYYHVNGGTITQYTTGGTWTTNNNGLIFKNNNHKFFEIKSDSEFNSLGLVDYNNPEYINIRKKGYKAKIGLEWNTKNDGTGANFNQNSEYTYSDFLTYRIDAGDHYRVDLFVNWEAQTYNLTYNSNNLLYGLEDVGETLSSVGRMKYSVSNKVVTVTGITDTDGYGYTNGRVELEAGVTYKFNATCSSTWGSVCEAFLMLNGSTAGNNYYHMSSNNNYTFTPTVTGTYWLRLDVNNKTTQTFSNINISKNTMTKSVVFDNPLPNVTPPTRTGYTFNGYYSKQEAFDMKYGVENYNTTRRLNLLNENNKWKMTSSDVGTQVQAVLTISDSSLSSAPTIDFNDIGLTNGVHYKVTGTSGNWTYNINMAVDMQMLSQRTYNYDTSYRFIDINGITSSTSINIKFITKNGTKYYDNLGNSVWDCDFDKETIAYASWTPVSYNIIYQLNGGTAGTSKPNKGIYDERLNISNPTRTGYTFEGWTFNGNTATAKYGTSKVLTDTNWSDASTKITASNFINLTATKEANITLTANWKNNEYTINYYLGNGTTTKGSTLIGTSKCEYEKSCTLNSFASFGKIFPSSSTGWNFTYWTNNETNTSKLRSDGEIFTYQTVGNTNLYAVGAKNFEFYSGINGETLLTTGTNPQLWNPHVTTQLTQISVPSPSAITGFTTLGYKQDNAASIANILYSYNTSAITTTPAYNVNNQLKTVYQRNVSLTFNGNGGTGSTTVNPVVQIYNSGTSQSTSSITTPTFKLPTNGFTNQGYVFTKWGTKTQGEPEYEANTNYTQFVPQAGETPNQTMYAHWIEGESSYKVQHWQQNIGASSTQNNTNYTLKETETKTAKTNSSQTPAVKTYTGFNSPSTKTITVDAKGTTVVNYYYTRKSYTITLTKGTGISSVSGAGTYQYGQIFTISASLETGYLWNNWTGTNTITSQSYSGNMGAANISYKANATPNPNTPYKVQHWQQKLGASSTQNSTNYTLNETDNLKGTTNTSVTPSVRTYKGFNSPSTQTVTISPDGSRVVNYYYTRKTYTVNYSCGSGATGTAPSAQTVSYGGSITTGSSFGSCALKGHSISKWSDPTGDTSWTNWNGTWSYDNGQYGISGNKLTLTATYTPNNYVVVYNCGTGSGTPPSNQVVTYGNQITISGSGSCSKTGHKFIKWSDPTGDTSWTGWTGTWSYDNGQYGITNRQLTLTAQWEPVSVSYKVQHWQQKLDGGTTKNDTNYSLKETQNLSAIALSSQTPSVKSYTGFKSPSTQTVTIAANGSTVVNYYYDRNVYTVTLNKGTGISSVSGAGSYQYGKEVTIGANVSSCYLWSSWSGTHSTTTKSYKFTVTGNVTDTANATKDSAGPTYSSAEIKNITNSGYDVYIYGVSDPSGVARVQFPTWTSYAPSGNAQDDIQSSWGTNSTATGTNQGNGTWKFRVNTTDHKGESGTYNTHIYLYDSCGNQTGIGLSAVTVPGITVTISPNPSSYGTVSRSSVSVGYGATYTASGSTLTFPGGQTVTASKKSVSCIATSFTGWSSTSGTITGAKTINANFSGVDNCPPTNGSISINSGAAYTKSTGVTLSLGATGATQMCISNSTSCSNWETYTTSKSWSLTSGDGSKTVYAWYRDAAGNTTSYVTDSITLDTQVPSISWSRGSGTTWCSGVTLTASCSDGGSGMSSTVMSDAGTTTSGTTSTSQTLGTTRSGNLATTITCTDNAGNSTSSTRYYTVKELKNTCTAPGDCPTGYTYYGDGYVKNGTTYYCYKAGSWTNSTVYVGGWGYQISNSTCTNNYVTTYSTFTESYYSYCKAHQDTRFDIYWDCECTQRKRTITPTNACKSGATRSGRTCTYTTSSSCATGYSATANCSW